MNKSIRFLFLYGFLIADLLMFNSSTHAQVSKVDDILSEKDIQTLLLQTIRQLYMQIFYYLTTYHSFFWDKLALQELWE